MADGLIADRRLYLDVSQSRVLEHNDPDSAWLLAPAGRLIPSAEVARLGLVMVDGRVQQGAPEPVAAPAVEVAEAPAPLVEREAKAEPFRRRSKKQGG